MDEQEQAMDPDGMAGLVLVWAKATQPAAYAKTLAVAGRPQAYHAYLVRLVELRAGADPAWRNTLPLRVLEQTGLTVRLRHRPTGTELVVSGRKVAERKLGFATLARLTKDGLALYLAADEGLDLAERGPG
jgi:hypothetical protein